MSILTLWMGAFPVSLALTNLRETSANRNWASEPVQASRLYGKLVPNYIIRCQSTNAQNAPAGDIIQLPLYCRSTINCRRGFLPSCDFSKPKILWFLHCVTITVIHGYKDGAQFVFQSLLLHGSNIQHRHMKIPALLKPRWGFEPTKP
jgi:hypothetical protein